MNSELTSKHQPKAASTAGAPSPRGLALSGARLCSTFGARVFTYKRYGRVGLPFRSDKTAPALSGGTRLSRRAEPAERCLLCHLCCVWLRAYASEEKVKSERHEASGPARLPAPQESRADNTQPGSKMTENAKRCHLHMRQSGRPAKASRTPNGGNSKARSWHGPVLARHGTARPPPPSWQHQASAPCLRL